LHLAKGIESNRGHTRVKAFIVTKLLCGTSHQGLSTRTQLMAQQVFAD